MSIGWKVLPVTAGLLKLVDGVPRPLTCWGGSGRRRHLPQLDLRVTDNGLHAVPTGLGDLLTELEHGYKLPLVNMAKGCVGLLTRVWLLPPRGVATCVCADGIER